jgi:hypothetical protein
MVVTILSLRTHAADSYACATDANCPAGKCHNQFCVECILHDDCHLVPGLHYCSSALKCTTGCTKDEDCTTDITAGPYCDGGNHKCVECMDDNHCEKNNLGLRCLDHTCKKGCGNDNQCQEPTPFCDAPQCVECRTNTDCKGRTGICSNAGRCVLGCKRDVDCEEPGLSYCDIATETCHSCLEAGHCPPYAVCSPNRTCVQCNDSPQVTFKTNHLILINSVGLKIRLIPFVILELVGNANSTPSVKQIFSFIQLAILTANVKRRGITHGLLVLQH